MKNEKKIPLNEVKGRLQAIMHYKNPEIAFRALLFGWVRHPRYKSPVLRTLRNRVETDGYLWLTEQERDSFSNYCGYDLT